MEPCECKNDYFTCHPVEGCICRHGYTGARESWLISVKLSLSLPSIRSGIWTGRISGENCDEQLFSRNIQEKEEGGYGHIVAVIFAAIIVVGMSLAAWMYHRRRVADLKNEIAQVQYIADPTSSPGKECTHDVTQRRHVSLMLLKLKYENMRHTSAKST